MDFRTIVPLPAAPLRLEPSSHVMLLGSCFAEEVGTRLADSLPEGHVVVNPCGVLYNPESIAQTLRLLTMEEGQRRRQIADSLFVANDGRWHSWLFSTKFTASSQADCLELCAEALSQDLAHLDCLVLTLGTDQCYRLSEDGRVVANCHKQPAALFDEGPIVGSTALLDALAALLREYPQLQVLLTVSPYRYAKYGFHESQLCKARLLLQADGLCQALPHVTYFPAYEILLDELRDYRFYAADMLHPSPQAADYIFERFREWCFSSELQQSADERQKALRRLRHNSLGKF